MNETDFPHLVGTECWTHVETLNEAHEKLDNGKFVVIHPERLEMALTALNDAYGQLKQKDELITRVDVLMDALAQFGIGDWLAGEYKKDWADIHETIRKVLEDNRMTGELANENKLLKEQLKQKDERIAFLYELIKDTLPVLSSKDQNAIQELAEELEDK